MLKTENACIKMNASTIQTAISVTDCRIAHRLCERVNVTVKYESFYRYCRVIVLPYLPVRIKLIKTKTSSMRKNDSNIAPPPSLSLFFLTFLLIYGASGGHLAAQGELTDPGRRFQGHLI